MQTVNKPSFTLTRRSLLLATGALALAKCTAERVAPVVCETPSTGLSLDPCAPPKLVIRATGAASLRVGEAVRVRADDHAAAFVVRDQSGLYALSAVCTHQCCLLNLCGSSGCTVPQEGACGTTPAVQLAQDAAFLCLCHGSTFAADGHVLTAPAKRALAHLAVQQDGGDVVVDLAREVATEVRV